MSYHKEYYIQNKEKFLERNKQRYQTHKDVDKRVWRNKYYLKNYGITIEKYEELLEAQNHVCAICKQECSRRLAVDHCHTTGKVRGLLCVKCNRAIGGFNDNIDRLKAAVQYMESYTDVGND